jgi:serine/threonine-protein kinase
MPAEERHTSPSEEFLRAAARAPAVEPELVGRALGRYQVLDRLGRGGMGLVYRARDSKLDRDVALKVLPPEMVGDPERRKRLLREARLAAAVTHPGLVAIYDVGEEDGRVYLAMELVAGRTLREREMPMPTAELVRIGGDVARALARAHEAGIIHRDLKPENVVLGEAGEVKILDFGLAKLREPEHAPGDVPTQSGTSTRDGRILGTPAYMSPEQAKGRDVTEQTDVFSLGVMLYEMATGRRPFTGETTVELLIAIDRDEPPSPRRLRSAVPAALDALVMCCLTKTPGERPRAHEVADALRASLAPAPARLRSAGAILAVAALAAGTAWVLRGGSTPALPAPAPEPTGIATATATVAQPTAPAPSTVESTPVSSASTPPSSRPAPTASAVRPRALPSASATTAPAASASASARPGLQENPPY